MKKQFSETLKPWDPPEGKTPSKTDEPQQKVGSPVPDGAGFRRAQGGIPEKQPAEPKASVDKGTAKGKGEGGFFTHSESECADDKRCSILTPTSSNY